MGKVKKGEKELAAGIKSNLGPVALQTSSLYIVSSSLIPKTHFIKELHKLID